MKKQKERDLAAEIMTRLAQNDPEAYVFITTLLDDFWEVFKAERKARQRQSEQIGKELQAQRKSYEEQRKRERLRLEESTREIRKIIPGYNDYLDQALCEYARKMGGDDLLLQIRYAPVQLIPLLWKAWQFDGKADSIGTPQANPGLEDER